MERPIPGKPIQLVQQIDGNLVFNEEAASKIASLNGLLGVVSVIGPYRTGKSYIMNRLMNRSDGFELGATYDSCTRGIWMWDTIIQHKNAAGQQMNLIFLDTEGLYSPDSTTEWDSKIFILTLLMSSLFIYNTKYAIDNESIKKLGIMASLAEHIKVDRSMDEEKNKKYLKRECPDFLWVLRDCFLELKTTETTYITDLLQPEEVKNKQNEQAVKDRNYIRESIKSFFKSVDCIMLPLPVSGNEQLSQEEMLQTLDNVSYDQLRAEFKAKMDDLCRKIKSMVSLKSFNSRPTNGAIFVETVKGFIRSLNENREIYVGESLTAGIRIVAENELYKAKHQYIALFDEYLKYNKLPIPWDQFDFHEKQFSDYCYKILEKSIIGSEEIAAEYINKFKEFLDAGSNSDLKFGKRYEYRNANSKAIYEHNRKCLQQLWNQHLNPLLAGGGTTNEEDFTKSVDFVEMEYFRISFKGAEQTQAYTDFLNTIDVESLKLSIKNWNSKHKEMLEAKIKAEKERAEIENDKGEIELKMKSLEQEREVQKRAYDEESERHKVALANLSDTVKELGNELKDMKDLNKKLHDENEQLRKQIQDVIGRCSGINDASNPFTQFVKPIVDVINPLITPMTQPVAQLLAQGAAPPFVQSLGNLSRLPQRDSSNNSCKLQ